MGALRGSLTFSRFYVLGDLPEDLAGTLKRVKAQAIIELTADEDVSERHGWASAQDPYDTELDHEKVFFNEYVVLGLRVDRWVIPGALLKAHLREAEQKLLQQKGIEKLGRKAKADLKDAITKKLRKRLVPVTRSYDLVWNTNQNVALFFSHSGKNHDLCSELFEKTFRLKLLLETPGTASDRQKLSANEQRIFAELEPTSLGEMP